MKFKNRLGDPKSNRMGSFMPKKLANSAQRFGLYGGVPVIFKAAHLVFQSHVYVVNSNWNMAGEKIETKQNDNNNYNNDKNKNNNSH